MSPTQITSVLNNQLPSCFVAVNPKAVRELASRAGRPYAAAVDEQLDALNDPKANNYDAPLREIVFKHAGRQVTVYFAKTRGLGSGDIPKLRTMALSIECALAEDPDRFLEAYVAALKGAIVKRGEDSDTVLTELTGTTLKWDAAG